MPKKITRAERQHQDYLRRRALKTASAFGRKLKADRAKEVRRVLTRCLDYDNPEMWGGVIDTTLDVSFLRPWLRNLTVATGGPMADSVVRDLTQGKASNIWEADLRDYAENRAGQLIVSVGGTLKDEIRKLLDEQIRADLNISNYKLVTNIMDQFKHLEQWQILRITQTETMMALGESGHLAAESLGIGYTKTWSISGLGNTRDSHIAMDGITVDQYEPFIVGDSKAPMQYPHEVGAPAEEVINCACTCLRRPKGNGAASSPSAGTSQHPAPVAAPAPQPAPKTPEQIRQERIDGMIAEMPDTLTAEEKKAIAANNLEIEEKLGIVKGKPMDKEHADEKNANPNFGTERGYGINCSTCSMAYTARRRGFDVTALPNDSKHPLNQSLAKAANCVDKWQNVDGTAIQKTSLIDWAKDKGYKRMTPKRYQEFYEAQTKEPGIYEVLVNWKGGGGHSTILERTKDGKLSRVESQSGNPKSDLKELCTYGKTAITRTIDGVKIPNTNAGIMRVDNKLINPKWVLALGKKG